MTAASRVTASERGQCLLCGKLAHVVSADATEVVVWNLCKGCGLAFAEVAERVASTVPLVINGPAARVLELVAGQLELETEETVGALELGAVLAAFRTGQWDGVATATLAHVLEHDAAGFRQDELAVLRAILRGRA